MLSRKPRRFITINVRQGTTSTSLKPKGLGGALDPLEEPVLEPITPVKPHHFWPSPPIYRRRQLTL